MAGSLRLGGPCHSGGRPVASWPLPRARALILQLEMGLPWQTSPKRESWGGLSPQGYVLWPLPEAAGGSWVGARGCPCMKRQWGSQESETHGGWGRPTCWVLCSRLSPRVPPEAELVSGVRRGESPPEATNHQPTLWS